MHAPNKLHYSNYQRIPNDSNDDKNPANDKYDKSHVWIALLALLLIGVCSGAVCSGAVIYAGRRVIFHFFAVDVVLSSTALKTRNKMNRYNTDKEHQGRNSRSNPLICS